MHPLTPFHGPCRPLSNSHSLSGGGSSFPGPDLVQGILCRNLVHFVKGHGRIQIIIQIFDGPTGLDQFHSIVNELNGSIEQEKSKFGEKRMERMSFKSFNLTYLACIVTCKIGQKQTRACVRRMIRSLRDCFAISYCCYGYLPQICTPKMRPAGFSKTNLSKPLGLKTRPRKHSAYSAIPSPASIPNSIACCFDNP